MRLLEKFGFLHTGTHVAESEDTRLDLPVELTKLDGMISDLKVQYEQYFSGLLPLPPDKPHADVRRKIRVLLRAPFKISALNFRLRQIVNRFQSLVTYWRRVLNEREAGTYSRDVFKANLRERIAQEDARGQTAQGATEKRLQSLFQSYRDAIEKTTGKKLNIDFNNFRKSLVGRTRELKEKHPGKKISFKVSVNGGKVSLKANVRE